MISASLISQLINNKTLLVILGPTASGKTDVSIALSEFLPMEIISADSRQIYKFLDIGTAKPCKEYISKVKHHFIDFLEPDQNYSAGQFADEAEQVADQILKNNKLPVVVGGSGLYIKALCEGLFEEQNKDASETIRPKLELRLKEEGAEVLYGELKQVDYESFLKYPDKNPRRIIRALEYYYSTGRALSSDHKDMKTKKDFEVIYFGITYPREQLYQRINLRTEIMWNSGLLDETKRVIDLGYSLELNSLNTVGYKETIAYLNHQADQKQTISEIQKNTRRYAKRQMTWFMANDKIVWLDPSSEIRLPLQIINYLNAEMLTDSSHSTNDKN